MAKHWHDQPIWPDPQLTFFARARAASFWHILTSSRTPTSSYTLTSRHPLTSRHTLTSSHTLTSRHTPTSSVNASEGGRAHWCVHAHHRGCLRPGAGNLRERWLYLSASSPCPRCVIGGYQRLFCTLYHTLASHLPSQLFFSFTLCSYNTYPLKITSPFNSIITTTIWCIGGENRWLSYTFSFPSLSSTIQPINLWLFSSNNNY